MTWGFGVAVYGIERGDVLLSLQLVLTHEEEEFGPAPSPQPRAVRPPGARAPSRAPLPAQLPAPPSRPVVMVDPATGAGTVAALRRDLALWQEQNGGRSAARVVGLEVLTLDQIRMVLGSGAADEVLRGLVEVAPFALQPRDRVYRFGRDRLVLLLAQADGHTVEAARAGLENAVQRFLAERGFPDVRLAARSLNPAAISA